MAREDDRIDNRIACLRTDRLPATLISDAGYHCEVWRSSGSVFRDGERQTLDRVIKVSRSRTPAREVEILNRDHRRLREALGGIVPPTVFVRTRIDGEESVIAMAPNIRRWFDVANPGNESDLAPMIARDKRLRDALAHFIATAERWYRQEDRVLDLYGIDNLVLDRNHHLHYIDSFGVFFHADLLEILPDPDPGLAERIRMSRLRLEYLNHLLEIAHDPN
ncbi:hypothetical protein [Spiribacter vilamensis]|uniref:PhoP regulatory network protein YrbL n=1 Tax=Spiribacter vilamensis TaxID=531306 RepID=A0A4Q8D194_9GAMM|nr:hypothetical protein [Spiribacter vilamensis]RZU99151.1 hypothetical protein EV698_1431 [Spiribacter vilamensis]